MLLLRLRIKMMIAAFHCFGKCSLVHMLLKIFSKLLRDKGKSYCRNEKSIPSEPGFLLFFLKKRVVKFDVSEKIIYRIIGVLCLIIDWWRIFDYYFVSYELSVVVLITIVQLKKKSETSLLFLFCQLVCCFDSKGF